MVAGVHSADRKHQRRKAWQVYQASLSGVKSNIEIAPLMQGGTLIGTQGGASKYLEESQ